MEKPIKKIPSPFTCPDCGGTLWQLSGEKLLQFRCRVGHEFSEDTFFHLQKENVENALWNALRLMEENTAAADLLTKQAEKIQNGRAEKWRMEAKARREQTDLIRSLLENKGFWEKFSLNPPSGTGTRKKGRRRRDAA